MSRYNKKYNTIYAREWRLKAKEALVASMGGECRICSYKECIKALDFHHVDGEDKDHEIGQLMSQRSWRKMCKEASKCVLLCCRCHRELHAGLKEYTLKVPIYEFPESLNIRAGRYGEGMRKKCPVSEDELRSLREQNSYDKLAILLQANKRTVMRWCKELDYGG